MVAVDQIPQGDALRLYLSMVAGRETSGYFEIRAKRATGAGMHQDFVPIREPDRAARSIANRGQATDTYVGVAPRTDRHGGLAAIERVWVLHADCDSAESLRRLADFRPLPSIVIRSGSDSHRHAYWPLRSPTPPASAKRSNQRLALALGADRNATDAARIMRPPLTFNHKHGDRRPVVCTRLEPAVFDLGQVVGDLADDPSYTRPRRIASTAPVSASRVLDGLAQTVRDAQPGNRNASLYWAACRVIEHNLDVESSRELLREAALAAGLPEHEIDRTLDSALERRLAA